MRVLKLYASIAFLGAMGLATISCQTAHKPTPLLPAPQSGPPTLKAVGQPSSSSAKSEVAAQPAQTATPANKLGAQSDAVADLIAQVEKEYEAGQDNYQAGHPEAAKQNFDRAFNLLLGSNLDIHSDERLQHEFDRILEGVNGPELMALQEGDGFAEQKPEPAPIDEANEVTFPVDPNIKAKAEAEIKSTHSDLPLMMTDQVAGYINYFSKRGRPTLEHALTRAGQYQDMIQRVLKDEGVPQDLIYLAQAESGFHPLALSHSGARGIWQFMASRAKGYGLQRNWWVDDRQDPEKATRAAARHLKDLFNQFGDWYLAMAAYNSGPGTVQSAVKRTGYADFWELYRRNVLHKETRNYVPIIVAVTIMAKNPAQYHLDDIVPDPEVAYDSLKINYPVDLRLVAECVDAPVDTLVDLNPSLLRRTTPKDQPYDLRVPAGSKEIYETAIASIPEDKRVAWRYHKVQAGDSLTAVARKYHTTEKAIAQANNLQGTTLAPETKLVIPISASAAGSGRIAYSRYPSRYKAHSCDTAVSVALDFGVPADHLRRWNRLKGNELRRGRVILVYKPLGPGDADRAPVSHHKKSAHKTHKPPVRKSAATPSKESLAASSR